MAGFHRETICDWKHWFGGKMKNLVKILGLPLSAHQMSQVWGWGYFEVWNFSRTPWNLDLSTPNLPPPRTGIYEEPIHSTVTWRLGFMLEGYRLGIPCTGCMWHTCSLFFLRVCQVKKIHPNNHHQTAHLALRATNQGRTRRLVSHF